MAIPSAPPLTPANQMQITVQVEELRSNGFLCRKYTIIAILAIFILLGTGFLFYTIARLLIQSHETGTTTIYEFSMPCFLTILDLIDVIVCLGAIKENYIILFIYASFLGIHFLISIVGVFLKPAIIGWVILEAFWLTLISRYVLDLKDIKRKRETRSRG